MMAQLRHIMALNLHWNSHFSMYDIEHKNARVKIAFAAG
jgi:hypothetical protein